MTPRLLDTTPTSSAVSKRRELKRKAGESENDDPDHLSTDKESELGQEEIDNPEIHLFPVQNGQRCVRIMSIDGQGNARQVRA